MDSIAPRRQPGSRNCFVCGTANPQGLGVVFFDDGNEVWTELVPADHLQGWPGVLHGGIVSAVLDETIGRVAFLHDRWVQTGELTIRFLRPAPLGKTLRATGRLVRDQRRIMKMEGELVVVESGEVVGPWRGYLRPAARRLSGCAGPPARW